jgi:hypothetical protein
VVVPAVTPVTEPPTTVAFAELLLQAPQQAAFDKTVVAPTQTLLAPEMVPAFGKGLTVIVVVATAVPQPLVTE